MKIFKSILILFSLSCVTLLSTGRSASAVNLGPINDVACVGKNVGDACDFSTLAPDLSFLTGYVCFGVVAAPSTPCASGECACLPPDSVTACDGIAGDAPCSVAGDTAPRQCVGGEGTCNTTDATCLCLNAENACPCHNEWTVGFDGSDFECTIEIVDEAHASASCVQQNSTCTSVGMSFDFSLGYTICSYDATSNVGFSTDPEGPAGECQVLLFGEGECPRVNHEVCTDSTDNDCNETVDDCTLNPACSSGGGDPLTPEACTENINAATWPNNGLKNAAEHVCQNLVRQYLAEKPTCGLFNALSNLAAHVAPALDGYLEEMNAVLNCE